MPVADCNGPVDVQDGHHQHAEQALLVFVCISTALTCAACLPKAS